MDIYTQSAEHGIFQWDPQCATREFLCSRLSIFNSLLQISSLQCLLCTPGSHNSRWDQIIRNHPKLCMFSFVIHVFVFTSFKIFTVFLSYLLFNSFLQRISFDHLPAAIPFLLWPVPPIMKFQVYWFQFILKMLSKEGTPPCNIKLMGETQFKERPGSPGEKPRNNAMTHDQGKVQFCAGFVCAKRQSFLRRRREFPLA